MNLMLVGLMLLSWSCVAFGATGESCIIVDHNSVREFDEIPDYWINKIKQDRMLVHYVGRSHALQLQNGLVLLDQQNSKYSVQINQDFDYLTGTNVLRVLRSQYEAGAWTPYGVWRGWYAYEYFSSETGRLLTEATVQEVIDQGDHIDISLYGWSFDIIHKEYYLYSPNDVREFDDDARDTYLDALDRFNSNPAINQTIFVYHTAITDDTYHNPDDYIGSDGWRVTHYNQDFRDAAIANDGILFDQADIENYDNATNSQRRIETWDDGGTIRNLYLRHQDYNQNNLPNTKKNDHTNDALAIRKAKALWALMARLAGWNGCAKVPGDVTGDCIVDSSDLAAMVGAWLAEPGSSGWNVVCDIAPEGGNGVIDSQDFVVFAEQWQEGVTSLRVAVNLDDFWAYQNLPGSTSSNLTANEAIIYDPLNNSGYMCSWEFVLPADVNVPPSTIDGGQSGDAFWVFAAPDCDEPGGLSDSGLVFKVKLTVTGLDHGNTGTAEADFGIALLGDVNNDGVVNVADRGIINAFWRTGAAGSFTLRDCDLNCDGAVNVADRSIANAIWRGSLGQNSVSSPCPFR